MEQFSLFNATHLMRGATTSECVQEHYRTIIIKYRDEAHFHVLAVRNNFFFSFGWWFARLLLLFSLNKMWNCSWKCLDMFVCAWKIHNESNDRKMGGKASKRERFVESSEMNMNWKTAFIFRWKSLLIRVAMSTAHKDSEEFNALNNLQFNIFTQPLNGEKYMGQVCMNECQSVFLCLWSLTWLLLPFFSRSSRLWVLLRLAAAFILM